MQLQDSNDKLIQYLNGKGYQPILLPKGGILPPTVYILDEPQNRYILFQNLADLLPRSSTALASTLEPAAGLSKLSASKKEANVSVGFMEGIMKRFGLGGAPKLDVNAGADNNILFSFEDVQTRFVAPGIILKALETVDPKSFGKEDLESERVHIAYEYLYSRKIALSAGNQNTAVGKAGAEIPEVVNLGIGAKAEAMGADKTAYDQKEPIAFAFRLALLKHQGGKYQLEWQVKEGSGVGAPAEEPERYIFSTNRVLEISDRPSSAPP